MALKVKTVDTTTASYAGGLVDAMPVIAAEGPSTIPGGFLVDTAETEEADDGVPVILVETATYETPSGALINSLPIIIPEE